MSKLCSISAAQDFIDMFSDMMEKMDSHEIVVSLMDVVEIKWRIMSKVRLLFQASTISQSAYL